MLPERWRPTRTRDLARVGSDSDGGYVVPAAAFAETDALLSCGLGEDWSFEVDFAARAGCRVVCYDRRISRPRLLRWDLVRLAKWAFLPVLFPSRRLRRHGLGPPLLLLRHLRFFRGGRAVHRRLDIGCDPSRGEVPFSEVLAGFPTGRLFVKMDIEGGEYRALDAIAALEPGRLVGIAIEFHDVDLHRARITEWLERMPGWTIVHIHGNGVAPLDAEGSPRCLEMTLLRSDLVDPAPGRASYPIPGLDYPNAPGRSDLPLRFEGDGAWRGREESGEAGP